MCAQASDTLQLFNIRVVKIAESMSSADAAQGTANSAQYKENLKKFTEDSKMLKREKDQKTQDMHDEFHGVPKSTGLRATKSKKAAKDEKHLFKYINGLNLKPVDTPK